MDRYTEPVIILFGQQYEIDYTNYKNERTIRKIIPSSMIYQITKYHTEPQFIIWAYDEIIGAHRGFAVLNIHNIRKL